MKKKLIILIILISVIAVITGGALIVFSKPTDKKNKDEPKVIDLTEVKSKYQPYVKVTKETSLYKNIDGEYIKHGTTGENVTLSLNMERELPLNEDAFYFQLKDLDYYVYYKDVEPTEASIEDYSYKNYILFNENVITQDKTSFYKDNNLIFTLDESINLPIIIKDKEYYYVEYANQLLGVKISEVSVQETNNSSEERASSIAVLNYHFFYDDTNRNECQQIICHSVNQFKSHLDYMKNNNFYTLKMKDMELFVDGKINLPKKSVLITIDDGWLAEKGIALLNEYQMNATVFLITSAYLPEGFESKYVEAHSHGDNLHFQGACPGGQGGAIKCYEEEKLLKDLETSRNKLHGSTVFCYPFYEYNDYSISVLQKAGFTMAFIGGNRKVRVGDNKMKLTRYPIVSSTNVNSLARILNS